MKISGKSVKLSCIGVCLAGWGAAAAPLSSQSRLEVLSHEALSSQRARDLDQAGYYVAALGDRIALVQNGGSHRSDLAALGESALALGRLESVASLAPRLSRAGSAPATWPPAFRAALAVYEFRRGRTSRADQWMPPLSSFASFRAPAARLRAIMTLAGIRVEQNRMNEAAEILGAVSGNSTGRFAALARLQRARILYDLGRYIEALLELGRVQKSSTHWYEGVHLAAWSAYKVGDDNLTLGQTMSLNSPHLARKFNPEGFILEAASFYRLCHYESAQRSLNRLKRRYGEMPTVLARFQKEYGTGARGVSAILQYVRGGELPPGYDTSDWELLVDGVLSQETFSEADRLFTQISDEQDTLTQMNVQVPATWSQEWRGAKQEAARNAGRALTLRLAELSRDVRQQLESALAVEVEINTRLRERLATGTEARMKEVDFEAEVKKGYEFWPFEGEYWRDELGGYTYVTTDVCSGMASERRGR